jgi:hypothetical protein
MVRLLPPLGVAAYELHERGPDGLAHRSLSRRAAKETGAPRFRMRRAGPKSPSPFEKPWGECNGRLSQYPCAFALPFQTLKRSYIRPAPPSDGCRPGQRPDPQRERAILASWASDACALEPAPELRATLSRKTVRRDDIIDALRLLDSQSADKPRPSRARWRRWRRWRRPPDAEARTWRNRAEMLPTRVQISLPIV